MISASKKDDLLKSKLLYIAPKKVGFGIDLSEFKDENVQLANENEFREIVDFTNHRLRKYLDYRAPHEVCYKELEIVALQI